MTTANFLTTIKAAGCTAYFLQEDRYGFKKIVKATPGRIDRFEIDDKYAVPAIVDAIGSIRDNHFHTNGAPSPFYEIVTNGPEFLIIVPTGVSPDSWKFYRIGIETIIAVIPS